MLIDSVSADFFLYLHVANILLKNGLGIAIGLNGDMQLWDVETCEYEGNLFQNPDIKDSRNPSLHNHNGRRINHAGEYILK